MQESEKTEDVSQRAVRNNPSGLAPLRHERSRRTKGKKDASAASKRNAFDFLNMEVEELGNDITLLSYGIDCSGCYDGLLEGISRFFSYYGKSVDFVPAQGDSYSENLASLINYIMEKSSEMEYKFTAMSYDPNDEIYSKINFVVYAEDYALENEVVVFYACPAKYMSQKGGELYKRFIQFVSNSMGVPLGANTDNYHLDMVFDMYINEMEADPDEEIYVGSKENGEIAKEYREGSFNKYFDDIRTMPRVTGTSLLNDLKEYKECCPKDEKELVECMIDGVPLIGKINIHDYDFNPEGYGDDDNSWLSSPLTTAILYSRNDGVVDAMISNINDEISSGSICYQWTRWLEIGKDLKEDSFEEFDRDHDLLSRFENWMVRFYELTDKFDKYGK